MCPSGLPLVPVTAALQEAALTLQKVEVELLAVSDGKRVVGSISVWDLALTACAAGYDPGTTPVLDVMSCQPVLFRVDMTAVESLQLMRCNGLSAVLAYDCKDRYEGVPCLSGGHTESIQSADALDEVEHSRRKRVGRG